MMYLPTFLPVYGRPKRVAVLFARKNSVYKKLPDLDVYDIVRDARTYAHAAPVIAHPPCRGWGRLRTFAKPRNDELDLAYYAVDQVRRCGGVLEHPAYSALWKAAELPNPGEGYDKFGGWSFAIDQSWFGHRAPKPTWLYIVGLKSSDLPIVPFHLGTATGRIETMGQAEREHTPLHLAHWLVQLALNVRVSYVTPGQTLTGERK
jgi:hypothetical protein